MKRPARLDAAKHWLPKYNGKNIVKGYARHFGVNMLCAATELQLLGYTFSQEYFAQLKANEAHLQKAAEERKRIKAEQKELDEYPCSDENFYFIAGYTPNGFPYGITWEQYEREESKKV